MKKRIPRLDIKRKMLDAGVSLTSLAFELGVPLSRFSNWVNGYSSMPSDMEQKVKFFFGEDYGNVPEEAIGE